MTKQEKKIAEDIVKTYASIESAVVDGYKYIESAAVNGYKKVEDTTVDTYKRIEDKATLLGRSLMEEYDRQKQTKENAK